MLKDLIIRTQDKNDEALLMLIEKFKPLMKKYAWKINCVDAYDEILLYFIKLMKNIKISNLRNQTDAGIVTYISKSIHSYYCHQIQKIIRTNNEVVMSDLSDEQLYLVQGAMSAKDKTNVFVEWGFEQYLTSNEIKVIYLIFVQGYSSVEVAKIRKQSRQSVNQIKKRALEKIRKVISV